MCKHQYQKCEDRVCVCVECGAEIPCLDWGQVDELYTKHSINFSPKLIREWVANKKQLTIPPIKCYNKISKREIWNARQIA